MTIFETKLNEDYKNFTEFGNQVFFEDEKYKEMPDIFRKRVLYYCKSRKWLEDVFGMKWESGLNLRHLLIPNQDIHIINEHRDPTEKVYAGGHLQYHYIFSAVSPLLQNFVSFRLWPEQIDRARDLVVDLRKIIDNKEIPTINLSGSIGLYWPHNDLKLQQGTAKVIETQPSENILQDIMLIPGLHRDARDLTWWYCFSDYRTSYIATDEETHFLSAGICIGKIDQKFRDHCQFRILGDNMRWTEQIFNLLFSGYRASEKLGKAGNIYCMLYFRELDTKTGRDILWLQDVIPANTMDIMIHLIIRKLHSIYFKSGRLKLIKINELEKLSLEYLSVLHKFIRADNANTIDSNIPLPLVIQMLLHGYYRKINDHIYFIPPGMNNEKDEKIISIDERLSVLEGKSQEKRDFYKNFLGNDDAVRTTFLTWLMTRINHGVHSWIPDTMGKSG